MADLFTVQQSAIALEISAKRVRQLIQEGKLTPVSHNPVMLEQGEVIKLRTIRAETPSVKRAKTERVNRSKSRDELLLDKFTELINQVSANQQRQLETVSASMQAERENFFRLLAEKEAEITLLKEQASKASKKGLFRR
jgi:hypothetical protein